MLGKENKTNENSQGERNMEISIQGTFTEIKTKQKSEVFERLCEKAPCTPWNITAVPGSLQSSGQLERKRKLLRREENQSFQTFHKVDA